MSTAECINSMSHPKKKQRLNEETAATGSTNDNNTNETITSSSSSSSLSSLFTLYPNSQTGLIDKDKFLSTYTKYQVVFLPKVLFQNQCENGDSGKTNSTNNCFHWKDISSFFSNLNEQDQSSWTIENYTQKSNNNNNSIAKEQHVHDDDFEDGQEIKPDTLLLYYDNDKNKQRHIIRAYSSFIVQHDKKAMKTLLETLPLIHLPIRNNDGRNNNQEESKSDNNSNTETPDRMKMKYGPCIWIFYGRNDKNTRNNISDKKMIVPPLKGRPEHTDFIAHHGTWHYQLSGVKEWHIRPTEELLEKYIRKDSSSSTTTTSNSMIIEKDSRISIPCHEGDVLLVNTRLWWHSTTIPEQSFECNYDNDSLDHGYKVSIPSVSYARDIYLSWDDNHINNNDENDSENDIIYDDDNTDNNKNNNNDNTTIMTNLDGLYASNDIECGTIIFTEADMPDCELHRTKDEDTCNCEVVELEDGSGAVVSCRDIKAGEFFCVLESDEEEEEDEYGNDEEEDHEEE